MKLTPKEALFLTALARERRRTEQRSSDHTPKQVKVG